MFKVVKKFYDLKDNNHAYYEGDIYPHNKAKVSEKRIAELSSSKNKMGVPLIEEIPEKPSKKATKKAVKKTEE
jgi:hypothetical protein